MGMRLPSAGISRKRLGSHTYTFSYTVDGGVIVESGQEGTSDEIFWTIIPDDHPATVVQSSATIHLPEGVQPQQYSGTNEYIVGGFLNGQQSDVVETAVSEDGRTITYDLRQPLLNGTSFEARTQFAHGLLDIPTSELAEKPADWGYDRPHRHGFFAPSLCPWPAGCSPAVVCSRT